MKNFNRIAPAAILLLIVLVFTNGCKKKSDDPAVTPSFTVTSSTVQLQSGGEGLQFFAKCTNNDVAIDHISITNPSSVTLVREYSGKSFLKNELFPMQESDAAYVKDAGTWKFNLVGNRTADGAAFAVDATLVVSK